MIKKKQSGSALVYILIAIAMFGLITATFMGSSNQQTSSQSAYNTFTVLNSQIGLIRSAIQECVLTYPDGDKTMPAAPVGTDPSGDTPVRPYPLRPDNTYMLNPVSSGGGLRAQNIRCPGNPGNSNDHAMIFGPTTGKFFPEVPPLFGNWVYYNDEDGVFIMISALSSDAFLGTALQKLDAQFAPCEAQYIDATAGDVQTTSDSVIRYHCASGRKCIVIHLVTTASTIYPGEPGGTCP